MRTLLTLAAVFLGSCASEEEAGPVPSAIVIDGATLINESGDAVQDSVVVIRGNRIEFAGKRSAADVPSGASILNARGQFLIPGLIDLHVHLGSTGGPGFRPEDYTRQRIRKNLDSYLFHGVTTVRSVGTERAEGFEIRNDERRAGAFTAKLYTAGRGFTGVGGPPSREIGDIARQPSTPEDARVQVRAIADQKADLIKIWIDGSPNVHIRPETVEAILSEAKKFSLPVHAHIRYHDDAAHFIRNGGAGFVHMIRDRAVEDFDPAFAAALRKVNPVFAPTLVRQELAWLYSENPSLLDDPAVAELVSAETLKEMRAAAKDAPEPSAAQRTEFTVAKANSRKLAMQGIPIGVGSDGGSQMDLHGLMTHRECELLSQSGFSPKEVLLAATRNGAIALGREDLGSIAPGKIADLVLLTADPLEDVKNLRQITRVMLDGKWVDRAALSLK
jgi:imidazolonepropionase-like amidohydrolase